jgi:hypothetical protein
MLHKNKVLGNDENMKKQISPTEKKISLHKPCFILRFVFLSKRNATKFVYVCVLLGGVYLIIPS